MAKEDQELEELDEVAQTSQAKVLAMARQYHQSYMKLLVETKELREKVPALEKEVEELRERNEELRERNEELNKFDRNNLLDFD